MYFDCHSPFLDTKAEINAYFSEVEGGLTTKTNQPPLILVLLLHKMHALVRVIED